MKIYDVDADRLEAIAETLGVRFEGRDESNSRGARVRGVLRANSGTNPYPRVSFMRNKDGSRRKQGACVCWHGHRDFMRAVFKHNPTARIVTATISYNGRGHFESYHKETGARNVGSMVDPLPFCLACTCPESGTVQ